MKYLVENVKTIFKLVAANVIHFPSDPLVRVRYVYCICNWVRSTPDLFDGEFYTRAIGKILRYLRLHEKGVCVCVTVWVHLHLSLLLSTVLKCIPMNSSRADVVIFVSSDFSEWCKTNIHYPGVELAIVNRDYYKDYVCTVVVQSNITMMHSVKNCLRTFFEVRVATVKKKYVKHFKAFLALTQPTYGHVPPLEFDLMTVAGCDHVFYDYGSFGFWGALLSRGTVFLPRLYPVGSSRPLEWFYPGLFTLLFFSLSDRA